MIALVETDSSALEIYRIAKGPDNSASYLSTVVRFTSCAGGIYPLFLLHAGKHARLF